MPTQKDTKKEHWFIQVCEALNPWWLSCLTQNSQVKCWAPQWGFSRPPVWLEHLIVSCAPYHSLDICTPPTGRVAPLFPEGQQPPEAKVTAAPSLLGHPGAWPRGRVNGKLDENQRDFILKMTRLPRGCQIRKLLLICLLSFSCFERCMGESLPAQHLGVTASQF